MRFVRTLLLALAAAIVVIVILVAVLPRVLNWNRYRGSFEVLAGDALGRPVTISGPISLSLLPEPVLTASRVEVGGGGNVRITVPELRLQVALIPLLSGEVDANALTLSNPVLRLAWPPRHEQPWNIPPWLGTLSADIANGTIELGSFKLTHINATLSAGRSDAALRLAGTAARGASTWQINVDLGEPGPGGEPLTASLTGTGKASGTSAKFSGTMGANGFVNGHVTLAGPNLARLITAPPLPFHAEAQLALASGRAGLRNVALTLGHASASGTGAFTFAPAPRLDLALTSTGSIPLDPWFEALRGGGQSRLPIAISLTSPRGLLARDLLQNVTLALVLGPSGARIGTFQAILPGEARFALDGRIDRAAGKDAGWEFVGTAHLAAPRLATTLHWLEAAAPHVLPPLPPDAVREATLSAAVTANAGQVALAAIKGTIDDSRVNGGASFDLGKHPAISAGLTFDTLDLDPWLGAAPTSLTGFSTLLEGGSVQLRLAAHHARLGGETISGLSLDAAATPGQLIVRRLDATIAGTHVIASGTIGAKGAVAAGSLALTAPNPTLLAHLLPPPLGPALAHWPAALSLSASAAGPPRELKLTIGAQLGNLRLTAAPVVDVPAGSWQSTLTLRYPDAARLIATSGLTQRTDWLGAGSFSLIAHAAGGPAGLALKNFRLVAGTLTANGNLSVVPGPPIARVSGDVHANLLPLPLPAANSTEPLPFGLFSGWRGTVGFSADQASGGGRLLLRDVKGRISDTSGTVTVLLNGDPPGGGAIATSLELATTRSPPAVRLGAAFRGIILKGGLGAAALDLASGTIGGQIALSAEGYSPAAMLATLDGTVDLTATSGRIEGIDLAGVRAALAAPDSGAAKTRLDAALTKGTTPFDRFTLQAKAAQGRFALGTTTVEAPAGQIAASGTFDLPARSLDITLKVKPAISGAPPITLRLAGPAGKPERLSETSAALGWLAAHAKHGGKATGSGKTVPPAPGAAHP